MVFINVKSENGVHDVLVRLDQIISVKYKTYPTNCTIITCKHGETIGTSYSVETVRELMKRSGCIVYEHKEN